MTRIISIWHRTKRTKAGEARPTRVGILEDDGSFRSYDLEDETAELDFVLGQLPTAMRKPDPEDNLADFKSHHIQWRDAKYEIEARTTPTHLKRVQGQITQIAVKVPVSYDGLQKGDTVAMLLGGSGDYLAYALSRQAETVEARVLRIPSFAFKHLTVPGEELLSLAKLAKDQTGLFTVMTAADRPVILIRELYRARTEAMKARIGCEQRLRQLFIGKTFCTPEGKFPEGSIEKAFDEVKANDELLRNLEAEETKRERELTKALETLPAYRQVFKPIEGCGPMLSARLIAAVGDIRRFETMHKFVRFCGVHVLDDGSFARRRSGQVANWHPDARQALYLLADQFVKRKDSVWGKKLREVKAAMRAKHPEPVEVGNGSNEKKVKRYTDGHIHKMAIWRTLTIFARQLWRDWQRAEGQNVPAYTPPVPLTVDSEAGSALAGA